MTTQYTLSRFEVSPNCRLADYEIKTIKTRVNQHIETINEGLAKGYKLNDLFIQTYYQQVVGMSMILPAIGILFEVEKTGGRDSQ